MAGFSSLETTYRVGNILQLNHIDSPSQITVKILKLMDPVTLSVVLHVEMMTGHIEDFSSNETAILKLFDRRFARGLREGSYCSPKASEPWDQNHDCDLAAAIRCYVPNYGLHRWNWETWTSTQVEAHFYHECVKMYQTEKMAYKQLEALQGIDIPKLYADITLGDLQQDAVSQIPGVLLEFIPGVSLRDLKDHVPDSALQSLCDKAIVTLHRIDDLGLLNKDVRLDNIIYRPLYVHEEMIYKPVFIDFALSEVSTMFSAKEWTTLKCRQDEEGALGYVAERHFRQNIGTKRKKEWAFPFVYTPSKRYMITGTMDNRDFETFHGPLGIFTQEITDLVDE